MARHKLTDEAWDLIKHLFPKRAETGRPPVDRRLVFDGILWILRTGAPWRDLPEEFGKWQTTWRLFNQWTSDGRLTQFSTCFVLPTLMRGKIDSELWCVDGTIVRAARCAAGGGKKGIPMSQLTMH